MGWTYSSPPDDGLGNVCRREGESLALDESNSLAVDENSPRREDAPWVGGPRSQRVANKMRVRSAHPVEGAHAFAEVTLAGATRRTSASLPRRPLRMPEIPPLFNRAAGCRPYVTYHTRI